MQLTSPARILLVLGSKDDRTAVQGLVLEGGSSFESVDNVEEARSKIAQAPFDLILLGAADGQNASKISELANLQNEGHPLIAAFMEGEVWPAGYAAGVSVYLASAADATAFHQTVRGIPLLSGLVFDWDVALENMGMMDIVQEIIKVFLAEAPALFAQVRQAMDEGCLPEIARAAHRFAGGIAVFGDIPCVKAARGLELAAEGGGSVSDFWFWLEQSYARLYATLQAV